MKTILTHNSAYHFWAEAPERYRTASQPSKMQAIHDAAGKVSDVSTASQQIIEAMALPWPIHVYADPASRRPNSSKVVGHYLSLRFPRGAFRRLADDLYISSPELCFLEMASELPFPQLVEFGYQLCGSYTLNRSATKMNTDFVPTTPKKVEAFLEGVGSYRGCAIARKALEYVAPNAASPREAKLAAMLTMPVKKGGFGFPKPVLNHRIDFTRYERLRFGRPFIVLDMYWSEAAVAVEYDGRAFHSSDERLSKDRRKEGELACRNIKLLRLDSLQLSTLTNMHKAASKLARLLNRRFSRPTQHQWMNRQRLYDSLFHDARTPWAE